MKIGSLFSGGGGGDLGFQQAGHEIVFGAEIDRYARAVLRHHHPNMTIYNDVKEVTYDRIIADGTELPDAIFGGSPCQDLSMAGRSVGLAGNKSNLFFEQIRIANELGTTWFIWENVTGAFTTNGRKDFAAVLGAVTGYEPQPPKTAWRNAGICIGPERTAVWRVLDLQHFGTPQRRRRIFLVAGDRSVEPGKVAEVLFEPESVSGNSATVKSPEKKFRPFSGESFFRNHREEITEIGKHTYVMQEKIGTLQSRYAKGLNWETLQNGAFVIATFYRTHGIRDQINYKTETTQTVKAQTPLAIATDSIVRLLTPLESERLMGWPDNYTATGIDDTGKQVSISDTQRYRICGNGIGAPVTKWIGERLKQVAG